MNTSEDVGLSFACILDVRGADRDTRHLIQLLNPPSRKLLPKYTDRPKIQGMCRRSVHIFT